MADNKLLFLLSAFLNEKLCIENDGEKAVIFNPFGGENIEVYYDEDNFSHFLAIFSFQHRHLDDEGEVIDWSGKITSGKIFAIEFFKNGRNCFGGEISSEELEHLSYQQLERRTGYYGAAKLYEVADSFKVRGWNKEKDFDGVFVLQENGAVRLEINQPGEGK